MILAEAMFLTVTGALAGIFLALGSQKGIGVILAAQVPKYQIRTETIVLAIALATIIALIAATVPAIKTARLDAAQALREEL